MSILKSIMHHYNKTTKSYDTLHPETESAQITDWNKSIVNTLASTALGSLVNTLTSDSLLATMIKKVLTATGVKYSIAQNGYLCFGEFYGGLIIQWGTSTHGYVKFPIAFTTFRRIILTHQGLVFMVAKFAENSDNNGFTLSVRDLAGGTDANKDYDAQYIAVGL